MRVPFPLVVSLSVSLAPWQGGGPQSKLLEQNGHFAMGETPGGVPLTIPSIDAAGVTYHAPSGHLFISDSEINEIPAVWMEVQANCFEVSPSGDTLFASFDLQNSEPSGIAYSEFDDLFYVTNDNNQSLYRYSFDGNAFSVVDQISTLPDSNDPEGVTVDPTTGDVYVIDGTAKVLKFSYEGQQLLHEETIPLSGGPRCVHAPPRDPEGIAYDPSTRHLFVVSGRDLAVYEHRLNGNCVGEYDLSRFSPRPIAPQGLAIGPASSGAAEEAFFIADGGLDNSQYSLERDAAVHEASLVPAPPGESFHFNGVNDYLRVPHAADLFPDVFTISAWIRPFRLGLDEYVLSTTRLGGYGLGIDLETGGTNAGVLSSRCRVGGTYHVVHGATPLTPRTWTHVALTYDGAAFRLYVNGSEDGSLAVAGSLDPSASADLFFGTDSAGSAPTPGTYYAGGIDEVAMWNVALTPAEIALTCSPITAALPAPANLVAHWRFEQLTNGVTFDELGEHDADVWGPDHLGPGPGGASVALREAAPNPASYEAAAPVLGSTWVASVDLTTTGHSAALVLATTAPAHATMSGGQVLLVGGVQLFRLPLTSGPVATWNVPIPADCSLLGIPVFTQAAHLFGTKPFALSNARDLILGY